MNTWETTADDLGLLVQRRDAALRLTLSRPHALNAFDVPLMTALRDALTGAAEDPAVRCVIVTGAGRAFSAGADLALDDPTADLAAKTRDDLRLRYNPIVRTLRTMPKPVIAAVNGPAVGVGCSIAMACDLLVAAESATFLLAFSKVGLTPDGGASLLLGARAGLGRANRLALLAERFDAAHALAIGVADEVVADGTLEHRTTALAEALAAGPTGAYAATKRALNAALLPGLDAALELETELQSSLVAAPDFHEGARAFAERRPPVFRGAA